MSNILKKDYLLSWLYLIIALSGALLTALANIDFVIQYGPAFNIGLFIDLANSNPAAQSLSRDLFVGASAFTIWIIVESRRLKMRYLWFILLSSITIAFAFAAPLFLCFRERRLIELKNKENINLIQVD
tara:strand:+ start:229 stop:615 length:387 start_codon:yes stop_codon:yes gene_type:complete